MAMVTVNGVVLPVRIDSLQVSEETVGATVRNAHGWALRDRRAVKRTLAFELAPKSLEEAMLYRSLILGEGEFWSMDTSAYGSKGLQLTGTGAYDSSGNSGVAANGSFKTVNTQTMIVPTPSPTQADVAGIASKPGHNGSTVVAWRYNGSAWSAVAFSWGNSDTSPPVKRERTAGGVLQNFTGSETLSSSATALTLTGPSATTLHFSGILWLPRRFLAAELDLLLVGAATLGGLVCPPLPRVLVQSDLFPQTLSVSGGGSVRTFVALGDVKTSAVVPLYRSGAWDPSSMSMAVELVEV